MTLAQLLRINGCHFDQLSEEKIVEMALLWRARDPLGRLPSKISGAIPQNIVTHVMGDPHWQAENWANINAVCKHAGRGLRQKTSLRQIFEKHLPALVQSRLRDPSRRSTPGCP